MTDGSKSDKIQSNQRIQTNMTGPISLLKICFTKPIAKYLRLAGIAVLSLLLACWVGGVDQHTIKLPFGYFGDALWTNVVIQGLVESGSWFWAPRLGTPYGYFGYDFPVGDASVPLFFKIVSILTDNWVFIINLGILFSFSVTALIADWVFRSMRIRPLFAAVLGILYALIPYHWMRSIGHLYLAIYFSIPIAIYISFQVAEGQVFKSKPIMTALLAFACGTFGVYYSYYSVIAIALALIANALNNKTNRNIKGGVLILGILFLAIFMGFAPTFWYWIKNGRAGPLPTRPLEHIELFSLKLTQILLPANGHRWPFYDSLRQIYVQTIPFTEAYTSTLGILGGLGFLLGLAHIIFRSNNPTRAESWMASLSLGFFLYGTSAGFANLFGTFGPHLFRSNNRLSIWIAFCGLAVLGAALTRWFENKQKTAWAIALFLLVFGVWDQSPQGVKPDFVSIESKYSKDKLFFALLESKVPVGAGILQLPAVPFPEGGSYEELRLVLNTSKLQGTFGSIVGRPPGCMINALASFSPDELAETLPKLGFHAILFNVTIGGTVELLNSFRTSWQKKNVLKEEMSREGGEFVALILNDVAGAPNQPVPKLLESEVFARSHISKDDEKLLTEKLNSAKPSTVSSTILDSRIKPSLGLAGCFRGWAVDTKAKAPLNIVLRADGRTIPIKATRFSRPDVAAMVSSTVETNFGFEILLPPEYLNKTGKTKVEILGLDHEDGAHLIQVMTL